MQIRCLGSLGVSEAARSPPLGGPKQRLVLAHLLVRANHVVSVDRLIAAVWDGDPPPAARGSLHSYISHLRRALGTDRIVSSGHGYTLVVDPDAIDRARFERLAAEGRRLRTRDPARAGDVLREALALWQGPPFADLADVPSLQPEITRLRELRLAVLEDRIAADLDAGFDRNLVAELEALVAEHPLRERLWGHLMVALYRAGRQADALATFDRARALLAEELGIDPSPELRSIHQRVLRQDPSLAATGPELKGYRLVERLGQDAVGEIWRATQPGVDRDVAIRIARPGLANDAAFIRDFDAHAQRIARIEHPHVVPLYDFWREPDGAYLVFRHLSGGSLRERLTRSEDLNAAARVRVADQIAQAVAAAHDAGIVHGAITADSVVFDRRGNAYLADVGVAHWRRADADTDDRRSDGRGQMADDVRAVGEVVRPLLAAANSAVADLLARATSEDAAERPPDGAALLTALRVALGDGRGAAGTVRARPEPSPTIPRNPYKGLRAFTEVDAADFFGRDAVVARLLTRLRDPDPDGRFLAVVGPSGSGKSSVVRAGLIPALRTGALDDSAAWFIAQMVPGDRPLDELATAVRAVAVDPPEDLAARLADPDGDGMAMLPSVLPEDGQLLVVIDQFEELFTLVGDAGLRQRFIDQLVAAVTAPAGRVRVVTTLRADFYDRPLQHAGLGALMRTRTETLLPLTAAELEHAVREPAERVGVTIEQALVAQVVADVSDEPGGLPLLQYALTELFDHRDDATVTQAAYHAIGGIGGALSRRAETVFAALADAGQHATRQLLLRLVVPSEGADDTRRRALVTDVTALAPEHMPAVLDAFGDARLLTFDRDPDTRAPTVEVAHEALLREWPRLRGWIDTARDDLRTHHRLHAAATDWTAADHDPSYLATGAQLAQYEAWRATSGITASETERNYLDASVEQRDRAAADEDARRQRERDLERRSVRRLRVLVAVLGLAAVVAGGLTVLAVTQSRRAADEAQRAERETRVATTRELAAAADANLDVDPERSILLALAAIDATRATDGTVLRDAEEALHRAVHTARVTLRVPGVGGALDWSPTGDTFVTEGPEDSGVIDIRDATTGASVRSWTGHDVDINDVVFSPDGTMLATAGDDGALRVWDPSTGELHAEHEEALGDAESIPVRGLAFSPDGRHVAGVWQFERLRVIDVATGELVTEVDGIGAPFNHFRTAFSPDGREIAVPSAVSNAVVVIDTQTGEQLRTLEPGQGLGDLAWSPDGRWIAAGWGVAGNDLKEGVIVDARSGDVRFTLFGHSSGVRSVDWSDDPQRLATGSGDGTVRIWDVSAGGLQQSVVLASEGMSSGVQGVAISPDGSQVMGGDTRISRVMAWDIDNIHGGDWAAMPAYSQANEPLVPVTDGSHVLTAGPERTVTMWEPTAGRMVREFGDGEPAILVAEGGGLVVALDRENILTAWDARSGAQAFRQDDLPDISAIDVSVDGQLVVATTWDGPTLLLDASGAEVATLDVSPDHIAWAAAFSPDGTQVAISEDPDRPDSTGRVEVWDLAREQIVQSIDVRSDALAFSPDGGLLATGQEDGATVWNVADGSAAATLTGHTAPVWSVVFDPSGQTLATTSQDGTVRLWVAETGAPQLVLPGHDVVSAGVAFVADGTALASGGGDGVARVWALDVDDLVGIAQGKLTRGFTGAECREYLHVEACP